MAQRSTLFFITPNKQLSAYDCNRDTKEKSSEQILKTGHKHIRQMTKGHPLSYEKRNGCP
jgi:hypothetical protein